MKSTNLRLMTSIIIPCALISIFALTAPVLAQEPIREAFPHDDFVIREDMVPMRDGVKLYTLILIPQRNVGSRS